MKPLLPVKDQYGEEITNHGRHGNTLNKDAIIDFRAFSAFRGLKKQEEGLLAFISQQIAII